MEDSIENIYKNLQSQLNLGKYFKGSFLLAMATLIGAFGGFPSPPKTFLKLTNYEPFQWLLVFVLVYQGGSGADVKIAAEITFVGFILYKIIKHYETKYEKKLDKLFKPSKN